MKSRRTLISEVRTRLGRITLVTRCPIQYHFLYPGFLERDWEYSATSLPIMLYGTTPDGHPEGEDLFFVRVL